MDAFALIAILTIVFLFILLGEQIKLKKEIRKLKKLVHHLKKNLK